MRCHIYRDPKDKKGYLIPGCWSVAISGDIDDCICGPDQLSPIESRFESIERRIEKLEKSVG